MWICWELLEPKVFPHSWQGNWFDFVCEWRWFMSWRPSGNSSWQTSHTTLLLRCDEICLFNRALLWNVLPHLEHGWFFSRECSHECLMSDRWSRHCFPHNRQEDSVSSSWWLAIKWILILFSSKKVSPHNWHLNGWKRAWISAWARRSRASVKLSPQTLQPSDPSTATGLSSSESISDLMTWVLMWRFRASAVLNDTWHLSQEFPTSSSSSSSSTSSVFLSGSYLSETGGREQIREPVVGSQNALFKVFN